MTGEEISRLLGLSPKMAEGVFVAANATIIGDVELGAFASVWFGAVLRGDSDAIRVGKRSNVQDNSVIHADPGSPCLIGNDCVIGHSAVVHGARLGHHVLVGMHSTILNDAVIGEYSIIGANALVPSGMVIPPYSLVMGLPAKVTKTLDYSVEQRIEDNVQEYLKRAAAYIEFFKGKHP